MGNHIKNKIHTGFLIYSLVAAFALGWLFYTTQTISAPGHEAFLVRATLGLMAGLILFGLFQGHRLNRRITAEIQRQTGELQRQVLAALEANTYAADDLRAAATRLAAASYEARRQQESLPIANVSTSKTTDQATSLADDAKLLALNLSLAGARQGKVGSLAKTAKNISVQTASLSQTIQQQPQGAGHPIDQTLNDIHQTVEKVTLAAQDMLRQAETISQQTQRAKENFGRSSKK